MGGKHVFDVDAIAHKYAVVDRDSKCWPVLLTTKPSPHNHQLCPCPKKAGHTTPDDGAHSPPA
eukprot:3015260-Pleurochrysis_carterae.AAC.1